MTDAELGPAWEPARAHMMIYSQGPQITILVDPDFQDIWRREPYHAQMQNWASEAARSGGYVIVFWQDEVFKI